MPNLEKQDKYKLLNMKLKRAVTNEFWLEACMIEYAIIEDRTSSILHYSNICKNAYDSNKILSNKLNSIEHQIGKKHPIISKKVNLTTVKDIRTWKTQRDDFVHRSCTMYDEVGAKDLALQGRELCRLISNDSAKVKRLSKKMEEVK